VNVPSVHGFPEPGDVPEFLRDGGGEKRREARQSNSSRVLDEIGSVLCDT
jgi:hypothetical protein